MIGGGVARIEIVKQPPFASLGRGGLTNGLALSQRLADIVAQPAPIGLRSFRPERFSREAETGSRD
jgi:hypothetical protein